MKRRPPGVEPLPSAMDRARHNPEHPSRLILLGTVHHDRAGFRRTLHALARLRPDRILVELSPFAWAFRQRHATLLLRTLIANLRIACRRHRVTLARALRHPEIQLIQRQLALPFEYRAALRYGRQTPAALLLIDSSEVSSAYLKTWPELIATDNLAQLLRPCQVHRRDSVASQYRQAERLLHRDRIPEARSADSPPSWPAAAAWSARERHLATQIEGALAVPLPCRVLYLGGWEHLSPHPGSLRSLVAAHRPRIELLNRIGTIDRDQRVGQREKLLPRRSRGHRERP